MFRNTATGSIGFALVPLWCFGSVCLTLAQGLLPGEREPRTAPEGVVFHVNQVAYDQTAPKFAVLETTERLPESSRFQVKDALTMMTVFEGTMEGSQECAEWFPGRFFYRADFSSLERPGHFRLAVERNGKERNSSDFEIGKSALATQTVPAIIQYYHHQRANSPEELKADQHLLLYGSTNRVDLRGGWCDASGDVSKYFSHLAYANFMSPQQTPLVVWSMVKVVDTAPALLDGLQAKTAMMDEAIYGADYLMHSLSPEGYFYMTVFSYFK
jgi:hypothetical protein